MHTHTKCMLFFVTKYVQIFVGVACWHILILIFMIVKLVQYHLSERLLNTKRYAKRPLIESTFSSNELRYFIGWFQPNSVTCMHEHDSGIPSTRLFSCRFHEVQTCGRRFTATWVGLVLFSEFPVSLSNLMGDARWSYFCAVKKNHSRRQRRKAVFCFLLRVAESWTITARSDASESVSILLAQLFRRCCGDIFSWWASLAFFSGVKWMWMHR